MCRGQRRRGGQLPRSTDRLRVAGHRQVAVSGQALAAEAAAQVRRHANCAVDDGHVEGQHDDERHRRVGGELKVVEAYEVNAGFKYLLCASNVKVPFVVAMTPNVAFIYRTLRVLPHFRRSFG